MAATLSRIAHLVALQDDIRPSTQDLSMSLCTVGRSPSCQIVVPWPVAARLHAKIERESDSYLLIDAGSANGTFVNGRRIYQPYQLQSGDIVGLGLPLPMLCFREQKVMIDS